MKRSKLFSATVLAAAVGSAMLAGCGGGTGADDMSAAQQTGNDAIRHAAAYTGPGETLVVRAKSQLAGVRGGPSTYKQGAFMVIIADGKVIDSVEVRATEFQDYAFNMPSLAAGTKLDIVYNNDLDTAEGQDRNLFIESITAAGQKILPTAQGVTFDRATADKTTAFDGIDVLPGTGALWWNGALRLTIPGASNTAGLSPACASLYAAAPGFALTSTRLVDPIVDMAKPAKGTVFTEPNYKTCMSRATDNKADGAGTSALVNDYSRHQAFNADNSKYLVYGVGGGGMFLYDAITKAKLKQLNGLGPDTEPSWHPQDPNLLYHVEMNGNGMNFRELNVSTNVTRVVADFSARVKAKWPNAEHVWTGGEGSSSKDARYWCFKVEKGDWSTVGVFTWDRQTDTILGMKSLSDPDNISMSPSGDYCVVSGVVGSKAAPTDYAVISYSRDFSKEMLVAKRGEHSDIAIDANGDDVYVSISYDDTGDGVEGRGVYMRNLRTGAVTQLFDNYVDGMNAAYHFSGKSFNKPGWVLVSTYGEASTRDNIPFAKKWMHDKVLAVELKPNPTIYTLATTRNITPDSDWYWTEPHATVNRDFTKVVFSSNWNVNSSYDVDVYMIEIPANALKAGVGSTNPNPVPNPVPNPEPTPNPQPDPATPLSVTVTKTTRSGYNASFVLQSNQPAKCRAASSLTYSYGALYDDIPVDASGLVHTKAYVLGAPTAQTAYAVCKANASTAEAQVTIRID